MQPPNKGGVLPSTSASNPLKHTRKTDTPSGVTVTSNYTQAMQRVQKASCCTFWLATVLGVDSPFFSTIVLSKLRIRFPWVLKSKGGEPSPTLGAHGMVSLMGESTPGFESAWVPLELSLLPGKRGVFAPPGSTKRIRAAPALEIRLFFCCSCFFLFWMCWFIPFVSFFFFCVSFFLRVCVFCCLSFFFFFFFFFFSRVCVRVCVVFVVFFFRVCVLFLVVFFSGVCFFCCLFFLFCMFLFFVFVLFGAFVGFVHGAVCPKQC